MTLVLNSKNGLVLVLVVEVVVAGSFDVEVPADVGLVGMSLVVVDNVVVAGSMLDAASFDIVVPADVDVVVAGSMLDPVVAAYFGLIGMTWNIGLDVVDVVDGPLVVVMPADVGLDGMALVLNANNGLVVVVDVVLADAGPLGVVIAADLGRIGLTLVLQIGLVVAADGHMLDALNVVVAADSGWLDIGLFVVVAQMLDPLDDVVPADVG